MLVCIAYVVFLYIMRPTALPFVLDEKICKFCKILIVPPITARVRLQKRCRRSRVNRNTSNKSKLVKNEMVYTCTNCNTVAFSVATCFRKDAIKKTVTPVPVTPKEKFSFRSTLSKPADQVAMASDFIPISVKHASKPDTATSSTLNLLDLERQNKKKRKSLQKSGVVESVGKKPTIGGPSLGSLQSLMNRKI